VFSTCSYTNYTLVGLASNYILLGLVSVAASVSSGTRGKRALVSATGRFS
jgi:hypothetical protein